MSDTELRRRRFVSKFFATAPKGTKDAVLAIAGSAVCKMVRRIPRVYVVSDGDTVLGSANKPSLAWSEALKKLKESP